MQGCTTATAQRYISETKEALDFQDSKVAELAAGATIFSLATPSFPELLQTQKVRLWLGACLYAIVQLSMPSAEACDRGCHPYNCYL